MNPLVSVIVPVYNAGRYLVEALDSLFAQTYQPIEIIVVDDGSLDSSREILQKYQGRIYCCFQEHSGVSAARNKGVTLAKGEYLSFFDADDLFVPGRLAVQMKVFQKEPELEAVFGQVESFLSPDFDNSGKKIYCPPEPVGGVAVGAMTIQKEAFGRVGFFNPDLQVAYFLEWYQRALELGLKTKMLSTVVLRRRLHEMNSGILHKDLFAEEHARVLKEALLRRRKKQENSGK